MPATDAEIEIYKEEFYEQCLEDPEKIYYQHDFQAMDVVPNGDVNDLIRAIQALVNEKCFKMLQDHNGLGYKCRSREDAQIHQSLNDEEDMVYTFIEEAGSDGIWTRNIKNKTRLHDAVIRSIFKSLEKRKLISDFKSMEHPGKIFYIKASIQPSERSTGGPFITDNEIDEEFVIILTNALENYIWKNSWGVHKRIPKHDIRYIEEVKALRDAAFASASPIPHQTAQNPPTESSGITRRKQENDAIWPLPPSYQKYPTLHDCTLYIMNSGITNVTLTEEDVQQLLDILRYDGRIEKVTGGPTGVAYKSIRKSGVEIEEGAKANGFTEAPCGRCPVFDLCEEGGPVGPSNCEYYNTWLDF